MLKRILFSFIICSIFFLSIKLSINTIYGVIDKKNNEEKIIEYTKKEERNINDYIGVLTIPKINLKRGFYDKESKLNDLSKNIYYLKESTPIDDEGSMIILAAHRGNSAVAFFDKLDRLKFNDVIILDYKNEKYEYIFKERYDELRDGVLNIYRDKNKHSLILITCNKLKKKYQTIYVSYRRGEE